MLHYSSDEKLGSGVPLGGMGAGKIEILPDGTITNFTYQNNWDRPAAEAVGLNGVDARVGNHFAVWANPRWSEMPDKGGAPCATARLLQTVGAGDVPAVGSIEYEGAYPFARLRYAEPDLPVSVQLEAFSPIVPGESRRSSMPAAIFLFTVTCDSAVGADGVDVAIMATARNMVSAWNVGRYNEVIDSGDMRGIVFRSDSPLPSDGAAGTVCLATSSLLGHVTCEPEWNMKTADPFSLALENEDLSAIWKSFATDGSLFWAGQGDRPRSAVVRGEGIELGGAVAIKATLLPGQVWTVPFVFAWHMPQSDAGHIYENDFADACDAAAAALGDIASLREGSTMWETCFHGSKSTAVGTGNQCEAGREGVFPDWLDSALRNNLYVLSSGTWWGRDGRFALFEASRTCQLMNTVDVLYYASVPLSWFYPDLELGCIQLMARAQRDDGYIPHDLGRGRLDYPSDGTTSPPRWKDLCPKFVLMAYRDCLWWGGKRLLNILYDNVKKAMLWEMSTDVNGDGLPDNEGADQTFDNWRFHGTNSYTSSIYLASLLACERMAKDVGDTEFEALCRLAFARGRDSFEDQLWKGRYYAAAYCQSKEAADLVADACTAGQLNGQWYAHLLDLGYIVRPERVASAVKSIMEMNGTASPYGIVNSVLPDGSIDVRNQHSANIWPGETYALAALAIYEGYLDKGLEAAKKVWTNIARNVRNPWDQPDVVSSSDGSYGFGDHYIRNMVIWAIPFALAQRDPAARNALLRLKGPLPW